MKAITNFIGTILLSFCVIYTVMHAGLYLITYEKIPAVRFNHDTTFFKDVCGYGYAVAGVDFYTIADSPVPSRIDVKCANVSSGQEVVRVLRTKT